MTSACVCQGWFDTKGRGKGGARGFFVCGVRGRPFTVLKAIETELKASANEEWTIRNTTINGFIYKFPGI